MAVATKAAPAATRTEYQRSVAPPISRRRRKRRSVILARTAACVLGVVFLLCYIGLYAQVTSYGYYRADLARQIRQAEMENQALRAEIQALSSPDRLAAVAVAAGMAPSGGVVYISAPAKVKVAKAE